MGSIIVQLLVVASRGLPMRVVPMLSWWSFHVVSIKVYLCVRLWHDVLHTSLLSIASDVLNVLCCNLILFFLCVLCVLASRRCVAPRGVKFFDPVSHINRIMVFDPVST